MIKTILLTSMLIFSVALIPAPALTATQESETETRALVVEKDSSAKTISATVDAVREDIIEELVGDLESGLRQLPADELKDYLLEKERLKHDAGLTWAGPLTGLMIPIVAIVACFGAPIIIVGLLVWLRYKRRQLIHQSISVMVEKGVEIPPHLFDEEKRQPGSAMRRGLVLVGVGFGIILFFLFNGEYEGVGIGFIPLMIGVAYLVVWKLENRQMARIQPQQDFDANAGIK